MVPGTDGREERGRKGVRVPLSSRKGVRVPFATHSRRPTVSSLRKALWPPSWTW